MKVGVKHRFLAACVAATAAVGTFGMGVARADSPLLTVSPSSGLADGQIVSVTVSGITPTPLGKIYIAECANAYGNATPLSSLNPTTDCETKAWIDGPDGTISYTAKQTGIGEGNRACIAAPPALWPCSIYTPSGINVPVFPAPVDISFSGDLSGASPQPTSTTVTAIGSPVATGKTPHAFVHVSDDVFAPDGSVTVTEGATLLGSATLASGNANVTLSTLPLGTHPLVAHYLGNGSFLASDSAATDMDIISADNISIGDVSAVGGVGATRTLYFPVVLSRKSAVNVTAHYDITPGTALPGVDYASAATSGTVMFKAQKQNVRYVTVKLLNDTHSGGSETFTITLSNPTGGYVLRRAVATGTIIDPASGSPTVNVASAASPEGDTGQKHALKFTVTLSAVQGVAVTAKILVLPGTATRGTGDYSGAYSRTIVFTAGSVSKPLSVPILSDTSDELDEGFLVVMSSVTGGSVVVGTSGIGTILSDE